MRIEILKELCDNLINFIKSDYDIANDYALQFLGDEKYFRETLNGTHNILNSDEIEIIQKIMDDKDQSSISTIEEIFEAAYLHPNIEHPDVVRKYKSWSKCVRDETGKITKYLFELNSKKHKFSGEVSREEMSSWISEYSLKFGCGFTAKEVSLSTKYTASQFRAILNIFDITKASLCAPHEREEFTQEELLNKAQNTMLYKSVKRFELGEAKMWERESARLTLELKKEKDNQKFIQSVIDNVEPRQLNNQPGKLEETEGNLIIWLSDWHIGAGVEDPTNPNYGYSRHEYVDDLDYVVPRGDYFLRAMYVINKLPKKSYNNIIVMVLGDMMDGWNGQTNRGTELITVFSNQDQINEYQRTLTAFIDNLLTSFTYNNIILGTVKGGNHDGHQSGAITKALFEKYEILNNDCVKTWISQGDMFGHFAIGNHLYVVTHGTDPKFRKKALSVNITPKDEITYREYIYSNNLSHYDYIHFVKGDLHQDNFEYLNGNVDVRTVASMFGASDYSEKNFIKKPAGVSYEIIDENLITRGMVGFDWINGVNYNDEHEIFNI